MKYTGFSILYLAWKQEDISEAITLRKEGWNFLQDTTLALDKAVYENRETIFEATKKIWQMTRTPSIMPIGIGQ